MTKLPQCDTTKPLDVGDICRLYLDKKISLEEAKKLIDDLLQGAPLIGKTNEFPQS